MVQNVIIVCLNFLIYW